SAENVDFAVYAEMLWSPSARCADHADGVRIIHEKRSLVSFGNLHEIDEWCNITFHAEHTIGSNESKSIACVHVSIEFLHQVSYVCMLINFSIDGLRPAQPCAVDDASMIQPVAIDHIPILIRAQPVVHNRCEKPFVCRKTRREENRVFHSEKFRD